MGKQPQINRRVDEPENAHACDNSLASRFPQHGIEQLQKALTALNERIAELESEGHQGHAMQFLRVHAMDLARQIDELRCLMILPPMSRE